MSSVVISGDTSGAITLDAPAVAGTNTITLPASTGTVVTTGTPASGNVIQVVNAIKTDTFSTTSTSFVDITNLTVSITPKFSTSKVLIFYSVALASNQATQSAQTVLVRNSTNIAVGDAAGSRIRATSTQSSSDTQVTQQNINYLDSPATTSATTYKVQMRTSGGTSYLNRSVSDSDAAGFARVVSTITVMEIAA